jgi:hypothetical protein
MLPCPLCGLALVALATSASASAQCIGWTFDRSARDPFTGMVAAYGDRVLHVDPVSGYPPLLTQRVTIERYDPVLRRNVAESRHAMTFAPGIRATVAAALHGTIGASAVNVYVQGRPMECVVHDVWGGVPRSSVVPLSTVHYYYWGEFVAVFGETVAILGAASNMGYNRVHFVRRDSAGHWALEQTLISSTLRSGYFDVPAWVDLDHDRVAYGGQTSTPINTVCIAERDALGVWRESAVLQPSHPGRLAAAGGLALSGDRLVVLQEESDWTDQHRAFVFERDQQGTWSEVQVIDLAFPPNALHHAAVELEGDRLVLGDYATAGVYEPDPTGDFVKLQELSGLGVPQTFDGVHVTGALIGSPLVRTAPVLGPGGSNTLVCATLGAGYCDQLGSSSLLRLHHGTWTGQGNRLGFELRGGPANGAATVFVGASAARIALSAGTLCVDLTTLRGRTAPFPLDTSGNGTVDLPPGVAPY